MFVVAKGAAAEMLVILRGMFWTLVIVTTEAALVEFTGWFGNGMVLGV